MRWDMRVGGEQLSGGGEKQGRRGRCTCEAEARRQQGQCVSASLGQTMDGCHSLFRSRFASIAALVFQHITSIPAIAQAATVRATLLCA
jgi:hypothetical protein